MDFLYIPRENLSAGFLILVSVLCTFFKPFLHGTKYCSRYTAFEMVSVPCWAVLQSRLIFQSLSHVGLFATLWTVTCQASLSPTVFGSLLKFMSIELVILPNHLLLLEMCHLLLILT